MFLLLGCELLLCITFKDANNIFFYSFRSFVLLLAHNQDPGHNRAQSFNVVRKPYSEHWQQGNLPQSKGNHILMRVSRSMSQQMNCITLSTFILQSMMCLMLERKKTHASKKSKLVFFCFLHFFPSSIWFDIK